MMIEGTIIDMINEGTIWLLVMASKRRIISQPVDHRCAAHIVAGVGVSQPSDLIGRKVQLSDDGSHIAFP